MEERIETGVSRPTAPGAAPLAGHAAAPDPYRAGRPGWRAILLVVAFWTLFGAVMAASLLFSPVRETSPPRDLVAFTFGGAYTWAALTLPLFSLTRRFDLTGERRAAGAAALGGIGIVVALLVSTFVSAAAFLLLRDLQQGFWTILRYRLLSDQLACLLVLTAGVARHYFVWYQARQEEAIALREQLAESRLEVLRAQLNPHFLFNTLNAMAALVAKDPKGARRMIARLSELLRYTLEGAHEPEVALERELHTLRRYLEILEIRYQGRLQTSVSAAPELLSALVPNLILQPLAENAMKHGVGQAGGWGRVEVEASRSGAELVLTVRDTGAGDPAGLANGRGAGSRGGGFGLRQTRERLEQLYGGGYRLDLRPAPGGGTVAEIRLPYHTRPERRSLPPRAQDEEVPSHA